MTINIQRIYYLIIVCCYTEICGLRSFVTDFESMKYEFDSKALEVQLQLIDYKNHKAANGSIRLLENVEQFQIIGWATAMRSNGRPWILYNLTFNGCDFITNNWGKFNIVASVTITEVKKHVVGLPSKCPLKKNRIYLIKNYMLNEEIFPPYLPEADFESFFGLIRKESYIGKFWMTGYVASKNGERYRKRKLKSN